MSRTALLGTIVFVVTGLSGCASPVRVVESDRTKVVVAVPDNTDAWPFYYRSEATRAASEMIQDPVLVATTRVKVGEQVTNTTDSTRRDLGGNKDKPKFGEVVTSTNTTSLSDKYEYHLEFMSRAPSQFVPQNRGGTPPAPVPNGISLTPTSGITPPAGPDVGLKPANVNPPPAPYTPATNLPTTTIPGPR